MNLSSFEYFSVLAREQSFTKAAAQLHITQQSLSSHIAQLENELGCQLLVRHVPLELTYAGTVFLQYSQKMLRDTEDLRREFCDITRNQKGILRIGIAFTRGRAIMPRLIAQFQKQYPNIEVSLSEAPNKALYQNLQNGEIDLAVAHFPGSFPDIELCDFYREEVVLLIPKTLCSRFFPDYKELKKQMEAGDLSTLKSCPFVIGNNDDIAGSIGSALIKKAGFTPTIKAKSENIETLLFLCLQNVGACFCPENLARAALSADEMEHLHIFHLGKTAEYPIQFGYVKSNYQ